MCVCVCVCCLCVCVHVCMCVAKGQWWRKMLGVMSVCISMQQLGWSRGNLSFPISEQSQVGILWRHSVQLRLALFPDVLKTGAGKGLGTRLTWQYTHVYLSHL